RNSSGLYFQNWLTGIGVDHGVLELPSDLLNLPDIDVLRWVAVRVNLDGTPWGILDLHLPQCGHERRAILDLSADGFHRFAYCPRSGVAVLGIERRQPVELFFKGRAESLVRWSFEGGRVVVGADHADR